MLSFEVSVIDIVLVISVVVLLLLSLAQRRGQPSTKSDLPIKGQKQLSEKPKASVKTAQEKPVKMQQSTDPKECVHHFGYLRNQPKNTPVPDECFGCPRILHCLFPNEENQLVH